MNETPLRAFVMLRSGDGRWSVTVCRDLDSIVQAWKSRNEPDIETGVLHIGFDRQPSTTFEALASKYPGRMLLTQAAKYTLPSNFVSSYAPVGYAGDDDVYLGLQGWGYSIEGSIPEDALLSRREISLASIKEPEGWLALFVAENPDTVSVLKANDVLDEQSYLLNEGNLARDLRQRLGQFRCRSLVDQNCEDPCVFSRSAPPWLLDREIEKLEIPVRAANVFQGCSIKTVRDLSKWNEEALLKQLNFGRKSLRDTMTALVGALTEGPAGFADIHEHSRTTTLFAEIKKSLLKFSERERDVIARRFGFERPVETLQEVAESHGVTRERIRQIESRAILKWRREYWSDVLVYKLTQMMNERNVPLPIAALEVVDSWFEGFAKHEQFFENLVYAVCQDRMNVVEIDNVRYLSLINQVAWEQLVAAAADMLTGGVSETWTESYAQSMVYGLLQSNAKEFGPLLWDKAASRCHFSDGKDGARILTSYGRGAEQVVEVVLTESDKPLHYSEIAEIALKKHGKAMDVRRAHSAASNVGYLFAPGVYGLRQHLPFSSEQMSVIRAEAEAIISEMPEKQWHCSEILADLLERLPNEYAHLDKYVLNIALFDSKDVKWLRKMTWAAVGAESSERNRIEIFQAAVAIVKAAGHPLSTSEIKRELSVSRGVNVTFQIAPLYPLVRLGAALWGLNERDVPVSREMQLELVEWLVLHLEDQKVGIHESEVSKLIDLQGCPLVAFLSIATQDVRVHLSPGRYLYLSAWGEPRRETPGQAVAAIIEAANRPLNMDELMTMVEQRIGRKCARTHVSGYLQALDANFDQATRMWTKNIDGVESDDSEGSAERELIQRHILGDESESDRLVANG